MFFNRSEILYSKFDYAQVSTVIRNEAQSWWLLNENDFSSAACTVEGDGVCV